MKNNKSQIKRYKNMSIYNNNIKSKKTININPYYITIIKNDY